MRTSKISQQTSKMLNATSAPPRRSTRSSTSTNASSAAQADNQKTPLLSGLVDIEDVVPSSKRKHYTPRVIIKQSPETEVTVMTETEENTPISPTRVPRVRKASRKGKTAETGQVKTQPPKDWAEVYASVKKMRTEGAAQGAAVDTMGCERLGQDSVSPRDRRYQTLIALMLSSQTKDTTNAIAMGRLKKELPPYKSDAPSGLNLENIIAVDSKLLNELIWVVGFHNNKTKYIKATAEILRDIWGGDIPDTPEGLMSLPGVGPKMAYLCLSSAWGKTVGIGVDVHVHRITNLWGWHKTKDPEQTRLALQEWLPRELWHEINWLLVGFGQTICLSVGRKCGSCDLGLSGRCMAADRSKVSMSRKKTLEKEIKKDEDGTVSERDVLKSETTEDLIAIPKFDADLVLDDVSPDVVGNSLDMKSQERATLCKVQNEPGQTALRKKRRRG